MGKAKTKTIPWDVLDHLKTPQDRALYLEAVLADAISADPDPGLVAAALGDIARSAGMTQVAQEAGLSRESLYKGLSPHRNPELLTVLKVMKALGLRFQVVPAEEKRPA